MPGWSASAWATRRPAWSCGPATCPRARPGRRRGCGWGGRAAPRLWREVPAAGAAGKALAAAGVALLGEPRELRTGWLVEVADPWGNVVGLTDYLLAPARPRQREAGH